MKHACARAHIYIYTHTCQTYHTASAGVCAAVYRLLNRVPINNTSLSSVFLTLVTTPALPHHRYSCRWASNLNPKP